MPNQLESAMAVVTLESLVARAKMRGLYGICVIGLGREFVATCLNASGPCDPRSWNPAASVEEALVGLETAMDNCWK